MGNYFCKRKIVAYYTISNDHLCESLKKQILQNKILEISGANQLNDEK